MIASKYEEVTWTHGGLYEAFQALADPRRVVFSMGVVDDGPHHEGGDGGEGWAEAAPAVVQGLLGLSVQQVCFVVYFVFRVMACVRIAWCFL